MRTPETEVRLARSAVRHADVALVTPAAPWRAVGAADGGEDERETDADSINAAGVIVGGYFDAGGNRHGFVLADGRYHTFKDPHGAGGTHTHGINAAGDIVGTFEDASGLTHGFLLHDGTYTTINVPR